eukprot:TRINITY_DN8093_c0_g1_i1.p1 TRINITY_DN8093_c0_g1~~TRINITY_DN8093_c0_g1_i1.p1  ORF type:complete len:952 (+),score=139.53 TRINITY_DN8093_c0_g1_i1:34-2889(+)
MAVRLRFGLLLGSLAVLGLVASAITVGILIYVAGQHSIDSAVQSLLDSDAQTIGSQVGEHLRQLGRALDLLQWHYDERGIALWDQCGKLDLLFSRLVATIFKGMPSVTTIGLARPDLRLTTGGINDGDITMQAFNASMPVVVPLDEYGRQSAAAQPTTIYDYADLAHNGSNPAPWWKWARELPAAERGQATWEMPMFVGWKDPTGAAQKIQVQLSVVMTDPASGGLLGVMWTACRLDVFSALLSSTGLKSDKERVIVLEDDGNVVAGTHAQTLGGLTNPLVFNLYRINVFTSGDEVGDTLSQHAAFELKKRFGDISQWNSGRTVQVEELDSETYYAHISTIGGGAGSSGSNAGQGSGLQWTVLHCKPRKQVLGDIITARTTAAIIAASIVLVLAVALGAVVFVFSRPLNALGHAMHRAAILDLSDTDETGTPSNFFEIRTLQESFSILTQQLREYKRHMPDTLLTRVQQAKAAALEEASQLAIPLPGQTSSVDSVAGHPHHHPGHLHASPNNSSSTSTNQHAHSTGATAPPHTVFGFGNPLQAPAHHGSPVSDPEDAGSSKSSDNTSINNFSSGAPAGSGRATTAGTVTAFQHHLRAMSPFASRPGVSAANPAGPQPHSFGERMAPVFRMRKIVVISVRVCDSVPLPDASEVAAVTKLFINAVVPKIKESDGVLHSVQPRHVVAHFSAITFVPSAAEKALFAASLIRKQLAAAGEQMQRMGSLGSSSLRVGIAVTAGQALLGDIGTEHHAFFGVVSPVWTTLESLTIIANEMGGVTLVDEASHSGIYPCRHVDTIQVGDSAPQRVYQPLDHLLPNQTDRFTAELDLSKNDPQQQSSFAACLQAFQCRSPDARDRWRAYLTRYPDDEVAQYYASSRAMAVFLQPQLSASAHTSTMDAGPQGEVTSPSALGPLPIKASSSGALPTSSVAPTLQPSVGAMTEPGHRRIAAALAF